MANLALRLCLPHKLHFSVANEAVTQHLPQQATAERQSADGVVKTELRNAKKVGWRGEAELRSAKRPAETGEATIKRKGRLRRNFRATHRKANALVRVAPRCAPTAHHHTKAKSPLPRMAAGGFVSLVFYLDGLT